MKEAYKLGLLPHIGWTRRRNIAYSLEPYTPYSLYNAEKILKSSVIHMESLPSKDLIPVFPSNVHPKIQDSNVINQLITLKKKPNKISTLCD
jgi:hypothetical protein